ncbi:MAG: site-specific integrase, partial [Bacteroidaceae bacterium]|nr:site-specific integrase [Bacteroidaceae bacterium]
MKTSKISKTKKEPVKLREKVLANGNISLYLDIYRNGKREYEFLKLYLIKERTAQDRKQNEQTLLTAQAIRSKRQIEIQNGEYGFTKQFKQDIPFLQYYRKMCEERHQNPDSNGNWGNWHSCLKYLEVYCDEKTTFKDIDADWIEGFKEYLNTVEKNTYKRTKNKNSELFQGLSQNSKVSYFNKLRACINQAFEERIIPVNPLRGVQGFKQEETERMYLTMDEVEKLAETPCNFPYLKNAFLFSCLTGLRKSDIEKLTWGDVFKEGDRTRIIFRQKKTKGQEYLTINAKAEEYLGTRGNNNEKVFSGFKYGSWVLLELKRWVLSAGITKNITFHCARHTFAVSLLSKNVDIYTVSKLLGHRELATTQIYAKVMDQKKEEA